MAKLNLHDLEFVLKQIKIGEAHANGAALTEIRLNPTTGAVLSDGALYNDDGEFIGSAQFPLTDTNGDPIVYARAIPDPKTPFGIRTVDGTYNNLVAGRETWGASDQLMPRMFDPNYIDGGPETPIDINGPAPGGTVGNTHYGNSGHVVDSDPRVISNLVADMSINNPAAIMAALKFAESEDPLADYQELIATRITAVEATANRDAAATALDAANTALDSAIAAYATNTSTDPLVIAGLVDDIQEAAQSAVDAAGALSQAEAILDDPDAAFLALAAEKGLTIENGSLVIPNVAPDEGISAPFNAWMTFFGQFFDHGLDLITKGGNGTVWIPLKADDPLITHGADGIAGSGDEVPAHLAFMAMTRATPTVDANGNAQHTNTTTPFVDQNQTYTSHASHQVFLREYVDGPGGPVATGRLLEGADGGLATWADVKAQARDVLGINLTDADVLNIPMVHTDPYGNFIPGGNGLPQLVTGMNTDGTPSGLLQGNLTTPVSTGTAVRIDHAFLDDIAHSANPMGRAGPLIRHQDGIVNDLNANGVIDGTETPMTGVGVSPNTHYDGDFLDRHFITGDGRGNENFGLTAVHHVFHSEHNRQTVLQKMTILEEGNLAFVNDWLDANITEVQLADIKDDLETAVDKKAFIEGLDLDWDGERIFQAARFATEMQYQHLVFEEFGRKVQPAIDPFVFNSVTDINPAIFSEFANVVYRFGHSMLTDSMPRAFFSPNAETNHLEVVDEGLVAAFLDPVDYDLDGTITHEQAAGAVVRGLTNVRGNAIDEFVVGSLRNNLLGLPLDLASINIARGRDTGMPSLNEAREELFAQTGNSFLKPYASWSEFAVGLKNPMSVVNFIAAYGTHSSITSAVGLEAKRDAAWELVFWEEADHDATANADRNAFINGTGNYAIDKGGMDNVDLWIGGLAEKILLFGGMLGSTFTAVFEAQMEALQDADRFYYLTRTQGLNFLDQLENNAFSKLIMANTDLTLPGADGIRGTEDDEVRQHIGIDSFAKYDFILEVNEEYQQDYNGAEAGKDPTGNDPVLEGLGLTKVVRTDPNGDPFYANYLRFYGGEHVVLGGSSENDILIGDLGDEGIWGDAGDDFIEGGQGVDLIMGGAGNDVILDEGDEGDFIKGDGGDDVIASSNGLDVLMAGDGKDVVFAGKDDTEVFGGEGDDFIVGGVGVDFLLGNEGDDWIEAGDGFDTTAGDNSELFFNSTIVGHDVMFAGSEEHDFDAESGDDIMVQGESVMRNEGMFGFDWATFQGMALDGKADMRIRIFTTEEEDILRNRFDKVEALSGWNNDDTLIGDDRTFGEPPANASVNNTADIFFNDGLNQAGIDRIAGLNQIVQIADGETFFEEGNILLGGGGNDLIEGNAGDDIIDGDRWLKVRISIRDEGGTEIDTVTSMKHIFPADHPQAEWAGKSLFELLVDRTIVPSQLHTVREIVTEGVEAADLDVAVFNDVRANYTITDNGDGSVTVTHNTVSNIDDPVTGRPLLSDGVDTLRNIEIARFTDGDEVIGNRAPAGLPVITSIAGDTILEIDVSGINDPNGMPGDFTAISVVWQRSADGLGGWTDVATRNATQGFEPNSGDNAFFQAVVTYTDSDGFVETVTSANTARMDRAGTNLLNGTDGDNLINGLGANDALSGGLGNDVLNGGAGNSDVLNGGGGDDNLDGGAGTSDRAIYDSDAIEFNFTRDASGRLVFTDLNLNPLTDLEGSDTLVNVERVNFSSSPAAAFSTIVVQDSYLGGNGSQLVLGFDGADNLRGGNGEDILVGGAGNDSLYGDAAADKILWRVGDGRDFVDGGLGAAADLFHIAGDATREIYEIFPRAEALAAGFVLNALTEIVIVRNGQVIAELDNIEEIVINGRGGGDSFIPRGNFGPTSLLTSTITIEGSEGDDTIDISGMLSAHRIVFKSNGGNDTIIGTVREQDEIQLLEGLTLEDYTTVQNEDGSTTLSTEGHSVTYFKAAEEDEGEEQVSEGDADNVVVEDDDGAGSEVVTTPAGPQVGTPGADVLHGTPGDDTLIALAGEDVLLGGDGIDVLKGGDGGDYLDGEAGKDTVYAGAGNDDVMGGAGGDLLYGEDDDDRIMAGDDDDLVSGGKGNDTAFGGGGNDRFLAAAGDGNDVYYGDEMDGGAGNDTLDMSAITANITADLGTGFMGRGSVSSTETGSDTLWGVENIIGGSGDDVITASSVANVMDGGPDGDDKFRFLSAADANGDTIMSFQPGDRIDLSGIDAKAGTASNQQFTLVSDALTGAQGELLVRHEMRDNEEWTVVEGNTTGGSGADFKISIKGSHDLTPNDFML